MDKNPKGAAAVPAPIKAAAAVQGESCGCCCAPQQFSLLAEVGILPLCPSTSTQTLLLHVYIYLQPSKIYFCLNQVKLTLTTPREFPAGFENAWV